MSYLHSLVFGGSNFHPECYHLSSLETQGEGEGKGRGGLVLCGDLGHWAFSGTASVLPRAEGAREL